MIEVFRALQAWSGLVADREARRAVLLAFQRLLEVFTLLWTDKDRRVFAEHLTEYCDRTKAMIENRHHGTLPAKIDIVAGEVTLAEACGRKFK